MSEWVKQKFVQAAVIKGEMGGNVEVDVVVVADETGSDVVMGVISQEETGIDVRVNLDDVGETGKGMRDSTSWLRRRYAIVEGG